MQYEKCVVWINPTYFSRHSPPFEATSNPALTAAFVDAAETPTASAQARNLLQKLLPESPKAAEKNPYQVQFQSNDRQDLFPFHNC